MRFMYVFAVSATLIAAQGQAQAGHGGDCCPTASCCEGGGHKLFSWLRRDRCDSGCGGHFLSNWSHGGCDSCDSGCGGHRLFGWLKRDDCGCGGGHRLFGLFHRHRDCDSCSPCDPCYGGAVAPAPALAPAPAVKPEPAPMPAPKPEE